MEAWVEPYRQGAHTLLKEGDVRDVDFSGSTYQVEVYDPSMAQIFWPFLQLDIHGKLNDAFCTCPSENGKCLHLAAAYLAIFDGHTDPLHLRFEGSFWNHLCRLVADHAGYDERLLEKQEKGRYIFQNDVYFEIRAKTEAARNLISKLIEKRGKETPENSIKFSNLPQEEIARWREGRPSPNLRYVLSFWADFAKYMMRLNAKAKIHFEEDKAGLPTRIKIEFPELTLYTKLNPKDLAKLIPYLDTVHSPLSLLCSLKEQVEKIRFDPKKKTFYLEHEAADAKITSRARFFEQWAYLPGRGFYSLDGSSLLNRSVITEEQIPLFLEQFQDLLSQYFPIHSEKITLSYSMHFDASWNWHFEAYLFEKGDLFDPEAAIIANWIYIPEKGFYPIVGAFFESPQAVLPSQEVSHFINHHRIWLNGQEGFQTHLASIESQLAYSVSENGLLSFQNKAQALTAGSMDFGDWMYYEGLGFFSKKHARIGLALRPGLEIPASEISSFIKTNQEELELVPQFFTQAMPVQTRGLEVHIISPTALQIRPVSTLKPNFSESRVRLFGDFAYIKGEGFIELPSGMRLPERYLKVINVSQSGLYRFIVEELPHIKKYLLNLPDALQSPQQSLLIMEDVTRAKGKLQTELYYQTEYGKVAASDLLEAINNKRRFHFSDAGLLDLQEVRFQWLRQLGQSQPIEKCIELSTLEFIRLDMTIGIGAPPGSSEAAHTLLRELREFSSHETPNIEGLKSSLRLYQQTGLHWLWFLYRNGLSGLLCDDMGLGKTHQAMALIAATLNQKLRRKKRYLVVCPTSVIYHWQDKLEKFLPHLKVHTFHGLRRTLKKLPQEGVILTTYGVLRMEKEEIEKIDFELAIFDEIQVAKNARSRIHEALGHVQAQMRLGLTGTPIENSLRELKSLFDIVLPGYMPSEARFRELFIQPIERGDNDEKRELLKQMIRPFVLRRKKTEVLQELPAKSVDASYCELSAEQAKLYEQILTQSKDQVLSNLQDEQASVDYVHIFSILSRLKQVCNHPALVLKDPKNYHSHSSGKWDLFIELLEEARDSQQKVVVFSQYLYMLDIIGLYLKQKGWKFAEIRGDTIDRRGELDRFQNDPECVVFIGSLQAAGLGIDLTAASVVILYDRWWNAARENQAIDRVHRIGQKWGVQVYKLITKETIEEKIDLMIERKGRLMEEVVTSDEQGVLKQFTRAELIELFSFNNPDSNSTT